LSEESASQLLLIADNSYAARAEVTKVRQSAETLRTELAKSESYDLAWRLSRALFFLGQEERTVMHGPPQYQAAQLQLTRGLHTAGADAGRRAIAQQPQQVEGHFWTGVNLALLAAVQPRRRALVHVFQARRALQKAIAIDPEYHAAGPLRVLGRLQHKIPRLLGGGQRRAFTNFERAIAHAPANTVTRIYFAELLLDMGEHDRAVAELETVLRAPLDPEWYFEIRRDQIRAKEILSKVRRGKC
jgi:tetratricopeptide (TPR) repeat protein